MEEINEAIGRLAQGDIGGLETIVTHYQVKVLRIAYLICQDEALAQDVAQDTFLHLYQHIHLYDLARPFEPYLLRSVVNRALNAVSRGWNKLIPEGDATEIEALLDRDASPETQVEKLQLGLQVLAALNKLSPQQRAVIVQRYYLDMSEKEMAEKLNHPAGTVKWLLHAARLRLQKTLSSERSEK